MRPIPARCARLKGTKGCCSANRWFARETGLTLAGDTISRDDVLCIQRESFAQFLLVFHAGNLSDFGGLPPGDADVC